MSPIWLLFFVTLGCAQEVWFSPDINYPDMPNLFSQPELWPTARNKFSVFKFYGQQLFTDCGPSCGANNFTAWMQTDAIRKLNGWGKSVGVEIGVVKDWDCNGDLTPAIAAVTEIDANTRTRLGGRIEYFDMDEPGWGGHDLCKFPDHSVMAGMVATWINAVKRAMPWVHIGDIEPYPAFRLNDLINVINALGNATSDLEWFHLDLDFNYLSQLEKKHQVNGKQDVQHLAEYVHARGLKFGVIIQNGRPIKTDQDYFIDARENFQWYQNAVGGQIDRLIFQSWEDMHPRNLPETLPYTHTYLLNSLV